MKQFEDIEKRVDNREPIAIPETAMQHLEAIKPDTSFLGTVVLGPHVVPVVFAKISTRTARKIGFGEGQFLQPNYKWNMIEDLNHDLAGTLSLMRDKQISLHLAMDPAHRATHDFLALIKKTNCFFLDLSVSGGGKIYGTTELMEVDGEHLEWVGRNLLRCRDVPASNNWQAAFKAFLKSRYTNWGDQSLLLVQPEARLVNANFAQVLVNRGETGQPIDVSFLEDRGATFNFDWMRKEHGIHVVDDEGLLTDNKQLRKDLAELRKLNLTEKEVRRRLERMRMKYPGEPLILSTLLKLYRSIDESGQAVDSVLEELSLPGKNSSFAELLLLSTLPREVFSEIIVEEWEYEEAADRLTTDQPLTLDEFLLFEQLMISALVQQQRLPEAIRRFSRLAGFAPKENFIQLLAGEIVKEKIGEQIKRIRKIPPAHCVNCWAEANRPAAELLDGAYRDHISYLRSEMKKKGLGVAPIPSQNGVRIGRNAPCPCGSGKKYKHCCNK